MNLILDTSTIAKRVIETLDADYAEVRLAESTSVVITLSGENIDAFTSGHSVGGSVRLLKNGAWGFVTFNDLTGIERFLRKGLALASSMQPQVKTCVVPYPPVRESFVTPVVRDFRTISMEEKLELIKRYNAILRSAASIQNTSATYKDIHSEYHYLNSEGAEVRYDKSRCGISLASFAKDGPNIQPFHESIAGYGGFEIVEGREEVAQYVVKTAVDLLRAESIPGGTYKVIADPKLSGVFIHEAFGHLSEADFVYENERMRDIMVLGKQFGGEHLNVVDDGAIPGLSGYIPIDDEGVRPEKTYLIKNGILNARLHSRETSCKMGEEPTGNARAISVFAQPIVRMTNTYIEEGPLTKEAVFDGVDGIYAIDVIGGQTNLEMFTFTAGYGYEIRDGKPGKMYKDIVLSGNVFQTLRQIERIGEDRQMFGGLGGCGKGGQSPLPVSFGGPHMLINGVLIGGKQERTK